ncbi:MAG: hypothetical protein ABIJ59_15385 [Pseudomonadota bacterium]
MIMVQDRTTQKSHLFYAFFKRVIRFVMVAKLLHLVSIIGLFISFGFGRLALNTLEQNQRIGFICYLSLCLYGQALIFFAQKDAVCRFQNYKQAKDLFFENRFKKRIVKLFAASRCQREAVKVAAADLGMVEDLRDYYHDLGYRWYHLIPDQVLENPKILFTRIYWQKTLFVPCYQSKYFLW